MIPVWLLHGDNKAALEMRPKPITQPVNLSRGMAREHQNSATTSQNWPDQTDGHGLRHALPAKAMRFIQNDRVVGSPNPLNRTKGSGPGRTSHIASQRLTRKHQRVTGLIL